MRWPWSPRPGMRRVSQRELVELLRGALRAADLEAEKAQLERETTPLEASKEAHRLLEERRQAYGGLDVDAVVREEVLACLPLTGEGRLHEAAFQTLVDARQWMRREQTLAALTTPGDQ